MRIVYYIRYMNKMTVSTEINESPLIVREPVRATVKDRLYDWILKGYATPGRPLKLSEAATRLGVSVTPIREALVELEGEGLVKTEMGRGFAVLPLSVREAEELYRLIMVLEAETLHSMPQPADARLVELDAINSQLGREGHDAMQAIALDAQWHNLLLQDAQGKVTREILRMLKRRVYRYEFRYMTATGARLSTAQHDAVVTALREGRRETAVDALKENWLAATELLVPWLDGDRTEARSDP